MLFHCNSGVEEGVGHTHCQINGVVLKAFSRGQCCKPPFLLISSVLLYFQATLAVRPYSFQNVSSHHTAGLSLRSGPGAPPILPSILLCFLCSRKVAKRLLTVWGLSLQRIFSAVPLERRVRYHNAVMLSGGV